MAAPDLCPVFRFLTHEFAPFHGGIATFVEETAAALARAGTRVEVFAPDYAGRFGDLLPFGEGVGRFVLRRFAASGRLTIAARLNLLRLFVRHRREWREDFSVWSSPGILWGALAFARLTGWWPRRPPIAVFHGSEMLKFRGSAGWRWLAPVLRERPVHLAGPSGGAIALLKEMPWVRGRAVHRLVCGCPTWLTRAAEHQTARPDDGRINVLTLARLHPRKGHLLLAEAMGRLPLPLRRSVRWIVRGDGEAAYVSQVRDAARRADVDLDHRGPVPREEMSQAYAEADLYALTSLTLPQSVEAFGITYLEAAIHSKPSVAFRTGGVAEAVLDGETGLLASEGDIPALTRSLERLLLYPELRRRFGQAARRHALGFRWEDSAQTLLKLRDASMSGATDRETSAR